MVYVTLCASRYCDAANYLSGDVGSGTKLVGVKTCPSHKVLSRRLNVVRLMRIFSENSLSLFWLQSLVHCSFLTHLLQKFVVTFLVVQLSPFLLSDVSVSSGSTSLSTFIPQNSHYSNNAIDDVLIIFFFQETSCSFQQTFVLESPLSFSLL